MLVKRTQARGFELERGSLRHTWIRSFLRSLPHSPSLDDVSVGEDEGGTSLTPLIIFSFPFSGSDVGGESLGNRALAIRSATLSKTETIMAASSVSLNTTKKMGTENTFGMMASRKLQGETRRPGERVGEGRGGKRVTGSSRFITHLVKCLHRYLDGTPFYSR